MENSTSGPRRQFPEPSFMALGRSSPSLRSVSNFSYGSAQECYRFLFFVWTALHKAQSHPNAGAQTLRLVMSCRGGSSSGWMHLLKDAALGTSARPVLEQRGWVCLQEGLGVLRGSQALLARC